MFSSLQIPPLSPGVGRARANTRSSMGIRDAVVNEVVAEENVVQEDQQRQAEKDAKASARRSFWTSWLYSQKPETTEPDA